ncbi:uncharacterized protein [Aegilops tauschii subsp. strangulata]|uniref:uncharacterized protein n=1 Tax=Aegilops tauschii subsp. strangulata TaxID=200361 RepID=UPI003CC88102
MVGPFNTTRGGMPHLLEGVNKFTKWIKARPIKKLDGPMTVRFIKDITVRYGILHDIITDYGTNFAKGVLVQHCSVSGIRLNLASVAHPQSNGQVKFTPFFLVYGAEAIIPTDIEFNSPRVTMYTEAEAKEACEDDVDLLKEVRLSALSQSAIYQQSLRHYHGKKIKPLAFREGDLVL